jgi:hypothetical protein
LSSPAADDVYRLNENHRPAASAAAIHQYACRKSLIAITMRVDGGITAPMSANITVNLGST